MTGDQYNRIDLFRQIKRQVRGNPDFLIVGIDIAKDRHHAFFGDANGHTVLKGLPFQNNLKGFQKLITHTEEKKTRLHFKQVVFGLEPTATYHKALGEYLIREGYTLVMVGAGATVKNRELLDGRWDKNDMKDAANIADLISQGKCLYYDHASETIRNLRSLLSLKRKLKKMEHSARMRIRNHLVAQFFPELDAFFQSFAEGCLSIIKHSFDPREIARLPFDSFITLVTSKQPTRSQWEKLKAIWELAPSSVGYRMTPSIAFEASMLVDSLRHTKLKIVSIDREIKGLCSSIPEYKYLLSIPGFGDTISAMALAAISDHNRFDNARQLL